MPALSFELFQMLLAIGWIDGELHPDEGDAILRAAAASLDGEAVERLRAMARNPVAFTDVDFSQLSREQRLLFYAVGSWVARADDRLTSDERAALHAIATLLGVTGMGRTLMDEEVDALLAAANRPPRLDLEGLRERIVHRIRDAATSE